MRALREVASSTTPADKRLATACARAALLAGALVQSTDDAGRTTYTLTRWAFTREFHDLGEVERVLDSMGAPR